MQKWRGKHVPQSEFNMMLPAEVWSEPKGIGRGNIGKSFVELRQSGNNANLVIGEITERKLRYFKGIPDRGYLLPIESHDLGADSIDRYRIGACDQEARMLGIWRLRTISLPGNNCIYNANVFLWIGKMIQSQSTVRIAVEQHLVQV